MKLYDYFDTHHLHGHHASFAFTLECDRASPCSYTAYSLSATKSIGDILLSSALTKFDIWPRITAICIRNFTSLKWESILATSLRLLTSVLPHSTLFSNGSSASAIWEVYFTRDCGRASHPNGYARTLSGCLYGNAKPLSIAEMRSPFIKKLSRPRSVFRIR